MNTHKIGLKQIERQYLSASSLEMARLIISKTEIYQGKCLELSSGAGYLGFALAENTMMDIYLLENNRDAHKLAVTHIARNHAGGRIYAVRGSICEIPLPDESMNMVTSKKSIFTWNNRKKIFEEVYRVLAPGGVACFCGGFEMRDLQFRVNSRLSNVNPKLTNLFDNQIYTHKMNHFEKVLVQAGIPSYAINCNDNGVWVTFRKPSSEAAIRKPIKFTYLGPPKTMQYGEKAMI